MLNPSALLSARADPVCIPMVAFPVLSLLSENYGQLSLSILAFKLPPRGKTISIQLVTALGKAQAVGCPIWEATHRHQLYGTRVTRWVNSMNGNTKEACCLFVTQFRQLERAVVQITLPVWNGIMAFLCFGTLGNQVYALEWRECSTSQIVLPWVINTVLAIFLNSSSGRCCANYFL